MTRAELKQVLNEHRVDPDLYSLYGEVRHNCICLLPRQGGWAVVYSERGDRDVLGVFETEVAACDYMAGVLLNDSAYRLPDS